MATNKLRKRLEGADDQTLSRMTENFCMIGTPLPSLDSKKDVNEYKPVWQQGVLDEQGRSRFHGAFTGGYSAGYYNSVGSKEGWTPSTFRSSRKDKDKRAAGGQAVGRKPEDFMDEEDLEALREGRGAPGSTQTYGGEQAQVQRDPLMDMLGLGHQGVANEAGPAETSSSIQVSSSSLGTRLLQRMGWRPGQGLGPRVSFKRRNELLAMLGKAASRDEKEDKEAGKHMWPPPDTPMPVFSTKQDAKGLGWSGHDQSVNLDQALKRARAEAGTKPAAGKKTGGFGLGALEEDSDGEDDVYAMGNRREESTLASERSQQWGADNDRIVLGGRTEVRINNVEPLEKDVEASDNVWHDGKAVLAGFHIASRSSDKEVWFEAPSVPKGWEPDPQQVWSKGSAERAKGQQGTNISSADRASILGEARLPGPPPSIQNYLSQKDRERLQRGVEAAKQHAADGFVPIAAAENKATQSIPRLDAAVAKSALRGFIPFSSEPEKQERYQAYLSSQADASDAPSTLKQSPHQTHQQFIAELNDFAKSASIFKPLSTVMASRFQSSVSGSSEMPQIHPGLHKPEPKPILSQGEEEERKRGDEDEKRKEEMQTMTALQRNARLGLFGKDTTREVKIWKPSRLLCKRFNVPSPYADEEEVKAEGQGEDDVMASLGANKIRQMEMPKINARWEESKKQLQQLAAQRSVEGDQRKVLSESGVKSLENSTDQARGSTSGTFVDVNNIGLGEVQDKEEDASFVKPSMDVFKAVFAEDDDNDDEEKQVAENNEEKEKSADLLVKPQKDVAHLADSTDEVNTAASLRPTFVPRKRRIEDGSGSKIDKKKKKEKKKLLLTFSVDGEEEEEDDNQVKALKAAPSKASRPRAADLFN